MFGVLEPKCRGPGAWLRGVKPNICQVILKKTKCTVYTKASFVAQPKWPISGTTYIRYPTIVVVVVLGAWRNSTETQQSGHVRRSGPEIKNGRSNVEDGAPERLGCETVRRRSVRSCRGCPQALH